MDRAHIARAYDEWSHAKAGHKNAWRVPKEHGSVDALIDELVREIDGRCLTLRPIKRYEHKEPTNGKIRTIGVESVKQQVLGMMGLSWHATGATSRWLSAHSYATCVMLSALTSSLGKQLLQVRLSHLTWVDLS